MASYTPNTDDKNDAQKIGHTVTEISEKASLLVREEIELAKAEISQKAKTLGKGVAVAVVAGIMAVFGLIYFFHFAAWALADFLLDDRLVWGYGVVTVFLFVVAAIAGLVGLRWIKKGSPPTPDMAIDEAKRIKETVSS
ncbi:MAG: phage holin family protein [Actinomycetota bacterium]|nr:phage holin family protein [Actinomycetota bacterium]MDQ5808435.1 phage holin family protein [Actinomycetota bacterium]